VTILFRPAKRSEVPEIVALLRDDILGQGREGDSLAPYFQAFDQIGAESNNALLVGVDETRAAGMQVVATYQLICMSGLSMQAARRAEIENVRVHSDLRGQGGGALMFADAERRARDAGCIMLQLTTNKAREDAQRFYARLGFSADHIGYKKLLG
jgi:GNAT superfamily N-acetyltransferase